jgi:hypothetical protein
MGPKAPQMTLRKDLPEMLDQLLLTFLPPGLTDTQRNSEIYSINKFVRELFQVRKLVRLWNLIGIYGYCYLLFQIRKNSVQKDFSNSYAIDNVTTLSNTYPFVSKFIYFF